MEGARQDREEVALPRRSSPSEAHGQSRRTFDLDREGAGDDVSLDGAGGAARHVIRSPTVSFRPLAAVALPAALACAGCLLVRPEPASLLAPLLGPWAGISYGHSECTLGNLAQLWSWIGTAAFAIACVAACLTRRSERAWARHVATAALALAALDWFALAWLSTVNTTS